MMHGGIVKVIKPVGLSNSTGFYRSIYGEYDSRVDDMMKLLAKDCVQDGKDYYFIALELNLLFKLNIENGKIEIVGSIPESKVVKKEFMGALCIWKGELYIAPYEAQSIWIYNINTKTWIEIPRKKLEHIDNGGMLQAFVYGDMVYMVGASYPAIIVINPENKKIEYIEAPFYEKGNVINLTDVYFRAQHVVNNGYLYIPSCMDNTILKINMQTYEFEWIKVGNKENRFSGITYDGKHFWLSPRFNTCVVEWNEDIFIEESKLPQCYSREEYYFMGIIQMNGRITACNMINTDSLDIVLETKKMERRECQFVLAKEKENIVMCQDFEGKFTVYENGKVIYMGVLEMDRASIEKYYEDIGLSLFQPNDFYQEGNIFSISGYLDYITKC